MTDNNSTYTNDLEELIRGLQRSRKIISPKHFYDERGSKLFEDICELPEYYLTRTELAIMREKISEISAAVGPQANVIEFGSGAGLKTKFLLEHLDRPVAYIPVDISGDHLAAVASEFTEIFPELEVLPVTADFTKTFPLPAPEKKPLRNLVYFPGSTIGNFPPKAATSLLRVMHEEAAAGGALLIGVDLEKDIAVLEPAYNDKAGVTAGFNLNMLRRLNREFGADFALDSFRHKAFFNPSRGRIEMHLVSQCRQQVSIGEHLIGFEEGEAVITEYSYKYSIDKFTQLATAAGFSIDRIWTDSRQWFGIFLCSRQND